MYKDNFVAVIKCGGKVLRECEGNVVYLPFGSEYSIFLKNKDARRALVGVEVDGENVLNGHRLVINGNTSQEIKGFMRDMTKTNRFKFINKTKEIQRHRGDKIDDGLVRIIYQFESLFEWGLYTNLGSTYNPYNYILTNNYCCSGTNYLCDCNTVISENTVPRPDEGITVKGEKINQNYTYTSIGNLEPSVSTIVLQLKGATKTKKVIDKPLTVRTKVVCEICGRKNKSTNKFCYNCGTYLN